MTGKKTRFKELTILALVGAALVSVACGDDDDGTTPGTSGSSGSSGSSTAGTAGSKTDGGSAGTAGSGGKGGSGGSAAGGSGGTAAGGSGGSENVAGEAGSGGVPTEGGSGGQGGDIGEPVGGAAGAGGAGGEGGAPVVEMDTLQNPGFEQPIPGTTWAPSDKTTAFPVWTNTSTPAGASYILWDGKHSGDVKLAQYSEAAYVADVQQVIAPIANGTYSFSVWVMRADDDALNESYLYAVGHKAAALDEEVTAPTTDAIGGTWVKITLNNILVTSGSLTIGMHTDANATGWANFDDAELTLIPE